MAEQVMIDKSGVVSPPQFKCYQNEEKLCGLRTKGDSHFECIYFDKGCRYSHAPKPTERLL